MANLFYLVIFIGFIIAAKFIFKLVFKNSGIKPDLSVYEKKPYLFDTTSEFNLYKILLELFGDKYYIFPQVNYSHLIQPRKTKWEDERRHRSRIDRKSADFVFCDKERIVPRLIIELDGSVHSFKSKQTRDEFINNLMKIVDLPILHLRPDAFDRGFIKNEVSKKLAIGNIAVIK
jgi:hypothetical protein